MQQPYGVILAGGRGTRMGTVDKALVKLGGITLLGRVQDRLEPQVAGLALSANGDPQRYAGFGLPVLADAMPDYPGPLAGILAGLDWAAQRDAEAVVSAAADTPFLPQDLVPRLLMAGDGGLTLARTDERIHPTFGLWPVALREDLRAALAEGVRAVMQFAEDVGHAEASFPADPFDPFFNINTPEDLARAEELL